MREYHFYVYIMASRSRTLYIGFTSSIDTRIWQHKNDIYDGFSKQYQCHRLVFFEHYSKAVNAIAREKQLKRWSRSKKLTMIERENPAWADLAEDWGKPLPEAAQPAGLSTARDDETVPLRSR